ncbi:hypothetical protein CS022_16955 [Veronia nyctiphanis]|uniref:DUF6434 domain-containing protein n=1 Tax=Veronia nyctiphanis TaxID=1278244 RepID=A0A4Q0YN52_9GAMM|nr:DUF6434 domain-containing protein [Veronia nyctiphanis]RXJ72236.1 hypothetical protein CS022_16955 [Veronia nyctiphanis]
MTPFDWHKDPIDDQTVITSTYKNTQNARRYFEEVCGDHFRFNRHFMAWMKKSKGRTMREAANYWLSEQSGET